MAPVNHNRPPFAVCVLAHNEERRIKQTLAAILVRLPEEIPVYVYANGCTDRTGTLVSEYATTHRQVVLRNLSIASKPRAWNSAFQELGHEILVFSDGDISPDPGAAVRLTSELRQNPIAVIATCRQVPISEGVTFSQRLVGFLQIPLAQDFLAGGFYAVRRQALADLLAERGLTGLPEGVTGEDSFLDFLVGRERLVVAECRSAYEPPNLRDYCRYLARLRWQNQQINLLWGGNAPRQAGERSIVAKIQRAGSVGRLFVGLVAVSCRILFKMAAASAIERHYRRLGPLRADGAGVLGAATRSQSVK